MRPGVNSVLCMNERNKPLGPVDPVRLKRVKSNQMNSVDNVNLDYASENINELYTCSVFW